MPIVQKVMSAGVSSLAANNIVGDMSAALTGTGTNKAGSTVMTSAVNYASITSSGKGYSLPPMNQGDSVEFYNNGANAALIYTTIGTSDIILGQSANGGFTVSSLKGATFRKCTSTIVMVNYSK